MQCRSVALVAIAAVLMAAPLAAQSPQAATGARSPKPEARKWVAPKTPWGHPDLSGTWTSDGAIGIPLARPDQFAGRLELTDSEFADKLKRDEQTRQRSDQRCGAFCDDNAWLKKSFNQTSLEEDAKKGIFRARKPVQFNERAAPTEGSAAGENGPPAAR